MADEDFQEYCIWIDFLQQVDRWYLFFSYNSWMHAVDSQDIKGDLYSNPPLKKMRYALSKQVP